MEMVFYFLYLVRGYGIGAARASKKRVATILVAVIIGGFPLLSVASVSSALDAQKSMERISTTGFSWWQKWSRERQSYRKSAMQCMASSAQKRPACWSVLAREVRVTAQTVSRENAYPYACQSVVLSMRTYWLDLAHLADKNAAGTLRYGSSLRDPLFKQVAKDLRHGQEALRAMADTGHCPRVSAR